MKVNHFQNCTKTNTKLNHLGYVLVEIRNIETYSLLFYLMHVVAAFFLAFANAKCMT